MKITLIGGSGFLGTSLSKLLFKKGISFEIFDLLKSRTYPKKTLTGDIRYIDQLETISNTDVLINLAAVHRDDIKPLSLYDEVNVNGSINICQLARNKKINKIIFISSVAIYGFAKPNTGENGEINYFNDYGRTKYLAEQEFIKWYKEDSDNRCLIIIRPTVIFGEGNRGNVYNLFKQIKSRKFAMFGDGKNIKSMAYVENVAAFIEFCFSMKNGIHIYNYIDKPDMTMNQLIKIVRKKLFKKNNVGLRFPSFLGMIIGYFADLLSKISKKNLSISSVRLKKFLATTQFSSKINEVSFKAPYSIEKALNQTLDYEFIEDNSDKITFETE